MEQQNIAIVGSGLVGSLWAIYLNKRGHKVTVFDRRPDIRDIKFSGRSINLAMSVRGWNALEGAGIKDDVSSLGIPMYHRYIHVVGKEDYKQPYGKEGEAIYSISRGILNRKMIDIAEKYGSEFRFEEKVWDVKLAEAKLYTGDSEKEDWDEHQFDVIFGCDGAFSRVRHKMQRRSRFNYSQDFLDTGYKELTIPAAKDGTHVIEKNALHIWPRGKFMLIALPNLDGSFTCTLFMPHDGAKNAFEVLDTKEKVIAFWEQHFPDTIDIMPTLLEDFFENPTSALVTMKCYPWTYWNKIALIGDSAHAIVPFYGQGMNAGFEDVFQLNKIIDEVGGEDWQPIFEAYQEQRKPNADAIAELSYRNFMEMSSKTADPDFILRKKIENKFAANYPELWMPLYSRVTFSNKPYAEALKRGEQQSAIMDEIMEMAGINEIWNKEVVMNAIKEKAELLGDISKTKLQ